MHSDYHVHLENGPLTLGWLGEFVGAADARGIGDLGVSEHGDRFREFLPVMGHLAFGTDAMPEMSEWLSERFNDGLDDYAALVRDGSRLFGRRIKLGLEADYVPGRERETRDVLVAYPFDYVLGSLHFLGNWDFDYSPAIGWPGKDPDDVYDLYFDTLLGLVSSGLFDVLGHADVVKVFGHRSRKPMAPYYDKLARAMADSGMSAEVNTAGWRKDVREIYPAPELLRVLKGHGVPVLINSDAHFPEHVGYRFTEALDLIRACGYTETASYEGRRQSLIPLPR